MQWPCPGLPDEAAAADKSDQREKASPSGGLILPRKAAFFKITEHIGLHIETQPTHRESSRWRALARCRSTKRRATTQFDGTVVGR